MKLYQLLKQVNFSEVMDEIKKNYPESAKSEKGYTLVFFQLLNMEPVEPTDNIDIINVSWFESDNWADERNGDASGYINVDGRSNILTDKSNYALDFTPRNVWLGMNVVMDTEMTIPELVAHILWEMTWHSFDEKDIEERREKIKKAKDAILNK